MSFSFASPLLSRFIGFDKQITQRLAKGGFWSVVGEAGLRALSFLSAITVARWLGVTEFGAYAMIQSTLGMLMTFALFGMGQTTTRYIATFRNTEPSRIKGIVAMTLWFSALTGLVAAAALYMAAPYIANTVLKAPELESSLRLVAPLLFFYAISGAMNGIVIGFEEFKRKARLTWIASIVSFIAIILGVTIWGLHGVLIGLISSEIVRSILIMQLSSKIMHENGFTLFGRVDRTEAKILWEYSFPLLLGSALNAPIMWACQSVFARQPGGMADIGMYDAALKWMTIVILIPTAASAVVAPVLANLSGGGEKQKLKNTTRQLALVQFTLTIIPAALVAMMSPWAVHIFGSGFATATPIVMVMMVLAPIFVLRHLYWQALTSSGHAWAALGLSILWASIALGLSWSWQTDGTVALAKALLAAYAATLIINIFLVEWIWND